MGLIFKILCQIFYFLDKVLKWNFFLWFLTCFTDLCHFSWFQLSFYLIVLLTSTICVCFYQSMVVKRYNKCIMNVLNVFRQVIIDTLSYNSYDLCHNRTKELYYPIILWNIPCCMWISFDLFSCFYQSKENYTDWLKHAIY